MIIREGISNMKKLGKALVAFTAFVAVFQATAVFAEDAPYMTYNIRLEENPVQTSLDPAMSQPVTKDRVAFHIHNNTNKEVFLVSGNDKSYIPIISENTVELPYSPQEFKVVDKSGNTMTSWYLGPYMPARANVQSASAAEFEQWGMQLRQVIASAQNRTVSYSYQKQEPMYNNSPATGGHVRGFW